MELHSQLKWNSRDAAHRVMSPAETCRRVRQYMKGIGVTRLADTTDLDTLGIPVFSAIRPTDAGMDGISVYNGKGLTKAESCAGAMMEAIERYCGELWDRPRYEGTFETIKASFPDKQVLNPNKIYLQRRPGARYEPDTILEWGEGWDLLRRCPTMIPLNFIVCPYPGATGSMWLQSSNGLASGNTIEESICHGLSELIERDAYTIAMVRASLVPRTRAMVEALTSGRPIPESTRIEREIFPDINLKELPQQLVRLIDRAKKGGAQVWLRDITSDLGIPTFVGSLRTEYGANGRELVAGGFGCHPNSTIAAIRAITEAVQGRNVQIQGTREDVTRTSNHKSADRVLWCIDSGRQVMFDEIKSYHHTDILDDINLILGRLRDAGVEDVFAVDLSRDDMLASVVRLIIPDLECWFLSDFSPDACNLGPRARRYLS